MVVQGAKQKQAVVSEAQLSTRIIRSLKQLGIFYIKLRGGPYQVRGMPDLLIVHKGQTMYVELKTETGELTPLQAKMGRDLINEGARWLCIRPSTERVLWTTLKMVQSA